MGPLVCEWRLQKSGMLGAPSCSRNFSSGVSECWVTPDRLRFWILHVWVIEATIPPLFPNCRWPAGFCWANLSYTPIEHRFGVMEKTLPLPINKSSFAISNMRDWTWPILAAMCFLTGEGTCIIPGVSKDRFFCSVLLHCWTLKKWSSHSHRLLDQRFLHYHLAQTLELVKDTPRFRDVQMRQMNGNYGPEGGMFNNLKDAMQSRHSSKGQTSQRAEEKLLWPKQRMLDKT